MRLGAVLTLGLLVAGTLALAGCAQEALPAELPPPPLPPAPVYHGPWPAFKDAKIRPGVQVITPLGTGGGAGECTSDFLMRTPDNATLYLGVAAHCFGEEPDKLVAATGTLVAVGGIQGAGRVDFNGWAKGAVDDDDCGLVKLSNYPTMRYHVHPAVLHFGGPTGVAKGSDITPGTHVITYGNSAQRSQTDPDNPREGYVLQKEAHRTVVGTNHPGIQGDSGSGLMTGDGQALGVLSMGTTNPSQGLVANRDFPSVNYYVDFDHCLDLYHAQPGLEGLELVTWPLIAGGDLPGLPAALA